MVPWSLDEGASLDILMFTLYKYVYTVDVAL